MQEKSIKTIKSLLDNIFINVNFDEDHFVNFKSLDGEKLGFSDIITGFIKSFICATPESLEEIQDYLRKDNILCELDFYLDKNNNLNQYIHNSLGSINKDQAYIVNCDYLIDLTLITEEYKQLFGLTYEEYITKYNHPAPKYGYAQHIMKNLIVSSINKYLMRVLDCKEFYDVLKYETEKLNKHPEYIRMILKEIF